MNKMDYEFNKKIHSIILNPYLSAEDFEESCQIIKKYNIKNISTSLNFLSHLRSSMQDNKIKINTLISYPFGDIPINFITQLISYAIDLGANGIEYTPNLFNLSKKGDDFFANDIENISKFNIPTTLILNKNDLLKDHFIRAINISVELGINNFQFGDGFGPPPTVNDLNEIIKILKKKKFIKIVGGIKSLKQVVDFLEAGADCIGTSHLNKIFQEINSN